MFSRFMSVCQLAFGLYCRQHRKNAATLIPTYLQTVKPTVSHSLPASRPFITGGLLTSHFFVAGRVNRGQNHQQCDLVEIMS